MSEDTHPVVDAISEMADEYHAAMVAEANATPPPEWFVTTGYNDGPHIHAGRQAVAAFLASRGAGDVFLDVGPLPRQMSIMTAAGVINVWTATEPL